MTQPQPSAHAATIDIPHFRPRAQVHVAMQETPPLITTLEGLITKFKWRFDALLEKWHRLFMAQKEHRIDPDYDPTENDVRTLRRAIEQLLLAGPSRNSYNNGGSDNRTQNWILGLLGTLLVSGVIGGVVMYGKLSSIEEGQRGHEQRIDRLERANENRYRSSSD